MQHGGAFRKLWIRYQPPESLTTERSSKRTEERTGCDLYVGNLDFKADAEVLLESIRPLLKRTSQHF